MRDDRSAQPDREALLRQLESLRARLAEYETAEGSHRSRRRELEDRLYRQNEALNRLAGSDEAARDDFTGLCRQAVVVAAETLGVERVSVWLFSANREVLNCEVLYERTDERFSQGQKLRADRYPRYFAALERGRRVAAHDAHQDPDTREFSEGYLTPLGVSSMLDAPLRRSGELIGCVCHEHVGPPRVWAPEEQDFASSVADHLSMVHEARERRRAERAFRSSQAELLRQQWQATRQVESQLDRVRGVLVSKSRLADVGEITGSIAAELQAPLASVRAALEFLERRVGRTDAELASRLGQIERAVRASESAIANLLVMAEPREPLHEEIDLEQALGAVARTSESVRIELDLEPRPYVVRADAEQLHQVLRQLIDNAAQAMGDGGSLRVRARLDGTHHDIVVADQGPGIPETLRDQVFEPHYTSRAKSTGLGLPVCRRLLERHGGTITLVDDDGHGAAFRIRLPVGGEADSKVTPSDAEAAPADRPRARRRSQPRSDDPTSG